MTETDRPVFLDEYVDREWEALAGRSYREDLTPDEINRYVNGPRKQPFGYNGYMVILDGRAAAFRDQAAYTRWAERRQTEAAFDPTEASRISTLQKD